MFKKILIANRGEIACRVMRTARDMGIKTVAVYSEADAKAPHVKMADEAVLIGPAPSAESYLKGDTILKVAKETGAEAIHPGYGFLSENAGFAEACAKAGIVFIGPSPDAIRAMGLKDRAKALMEKAGVPVTPGYHGEDQDPEHLKAEANRIGYPVLIKAVAGGGGKGMRKVDAEKDFLSALESCQREASKSFGDDNVLIEKFITSPRHIEVQVFGDSHGNVIHLYERDCSLQRRHQKVIEEAPAPGMTNEVRAAMTRAAVDAAKAVNYSGAGTVEFIVDGSGALRPDGFFFMEMNTRLQVEHPVTEMVTGLDLVKLQLEVAAGGKVPSQDAITLTGHAIEARLYAEDPQSGFLPSIGTLEQFELNTPRFDGPSASVERQDELRASPMSATGRIDTGVEAGGEVSLHYDPMIAKVIAWRSQREDAATDLAEALRKSSIAGVKTNAAFLIRCLESEAFLNGDVETRFIDANLEALTTPRITSEIAVASGAVALIEMLREPDRLASDLSSFPHLVKESRRGIARTVLASGRDERRNGFSPWNAAGGFRLNADPRIQISLSQGDQIYTVRLSETGEGWQTTVNETSFDFEVGYVDAGRVAISLLSDKVATEISVDVFDGDLIVKADGETQRVTEARPDALADALEAGNLVKAPMPGKVLAVHVKPGQAVSKGDALVVLEAMKMEHALTAPRDGVVDSVSAEAGAQVGEGDALITLAAEEDAAA